MTRRRLAAATGALAAVAWAVLVAASPPAFFTIAAPFCAAWIALSLAAVPAGLARTLRVTAADVVLGLASGLVLYLAARLFLRATCGPLSAVLCAPLGEMFARFHTRTVPAALVLGLLVAPAEELFWRGVVQGHLARRIGVALAVATATALAAILSLATGEPFLALAIAPSYAAWGALAAWRGSLVPAIASHALWTVLIASAAPPS